MHVVGVTLIEKACLSMNVCNPKLLISLKPLETIYLTGLLIASISNIVS